MQGCLALRDAQLFGLWPRPVAVPADVSPACPKAGSLWESDAAAAHARQHGLAPGVLRYWILQRWAAFHFADAGGRRCQSFVITQWQKATGRPETGAFTAADIDELQRSWLPLLERFRQIAASVAQGNQDERARQVQEAQARAEADMQRQAQNLRQAREADGLRQSRRQAQEAAALKLLEQDRRRVEQALAKRRPRLQAECSELARASAAAARSRDLSMWAHGDLREYHMRHEQEIFEADQRSCLQNATLQMAIELLEPERP